MFRSMKLGILFILLFPIVCYAIKVPGLYETEVSVADQSESNRKIAIKTALRQVLVKLTGDRNVTANKVLKPLLQNAEKHTQLYRYRNEPDGNGNRWKLQVCFDEITTDKILRSLGVPVWGKERPATLLWLTIEDDSGRKLINPSGEAEYLTVIENRMATRGIVLVYPLMDLIDTSSLRPSDIWGGIKETVLNASDRYGTDAILTGYINSRTTKIWEGAWTALVDGKITHWNTDGNLPSVVLNKGIDDMANILAEQYASSNIFKEVAEVQITVKKIDSLDQYAHVLKYLESLTSVSEVMVNRVEPGRVTFTLTVHGGSLAISQVIALGRELQQIGGKNSLVYRLPP